MFSLTSPLNVCLCLPGHQSEILNRKREGRKEERKEEEKEAENSDRVGLVMKRRREKKREHSGELPFSPNRSPH